jgi:hypothetical protein
MMNHLGYDLIYREYDLSWTQKTEHMSLIAFLEFVQKQRHGVS